MEIPLTRITNKNGDNIFFDAVKFVQVCRDADNDGFYGDGACGTFVDCNDNNPNVNPGADESCNDGIDNDATAMST